MLIGGTHKPDTHYGNDNTKYRFKPIPSGKGKNEAYFVLVNKETGATEVWNNEFGRDRQVGTYNAKDKEFVPITNSPTIGMDARKFEQEYFTSDAGMRKIVAQSKNVITKEVYNDTSMGVSEPDRLQAGKTKANQLMNDGTSSIDESDTESLKGLSREAQDKLMETKGRKYFPNLRYPEKMDENQDAIKFTIRDFKPREWDKDQPGVLKERDRSNAALHKFNMGSVILPMPAGLKDNNQQDWGNATMNPVQAVGAQLALAAFNSADAAGGLLKNIAGDMNSEGMDKVAQEAIAGQITGLGGQLIKRQGALINPNVELLFNSPQLRSFNFTFNLSPRNPKEAQTIKQIIRLFKQGSAPRRTVKGYFLRTPLIYQISYINNAYNLNRFKECAMTSFQTDYTPNGNYSTLRDGTMSQYKISMSFTELDPIFNDDYDTLDKESGENFSFPLKNPTGDAAGIGY